MDIHMSNKDTSTDKLDGEFRVPLSYGGGSKKNKWLCCVYCDKETCLSINCQGFVCKKCHKYNADISKCEKLFVKLDKDCLLFHESSATHVLSRGAKVHMGVHDSHTIRAEMSKDGISRSSVGGQKYRKEYNKRLKQNNVKKSRYTKV